MAPRKIPAKYSCQEIYDRMSNGLCIFCEDLDTPGHHDLKHKGVKIFVTESDNESIMTESDDKPIAEESYGFVTETVMQPDLFSESLEGSTSDLQVVIAAGQKEAQNKSDSEENMSLSLGNKIEHLVGKHTQKAVRVWEPGGFIAKPATQSQGIKSFCNSIQQNEAIHSAEMIPVMLHPRLNVAAERVWEPGGLLTKLDMGDGTEKCLTHGQVPVLFVQPARATINRKEMCVIRVWEPDIYGSCEEFEWLLRYGCRETDAATSLLNEVSTHETYPHVDQVYLHVKGLEALPEKITSSNDANVSKRLCEQVPLRVMSTEQCKSLWFSAAMSDVRLTRQLHIQAKELLSEFQNVPRVLVSVSEFGAKIYKPPDPNEKLQHDEILGKFRRAKELMAENSRDTRFLVEGLRNCIQTFEELGKHMTQECSLSASVWDLLTKQSRSCSFFEFLLQWKWYPPEQSYQAFSVWFLRWWTWQKKDKFFASRWLILVERVASPSYIPGQLCIKSTQTHVDVFIRISTEMTSVTNTWRIHDSFQVTVEYKYNGNRDAHKPPVLIKGYGDRNIMESLCSPMNENQSVLHETNHIAFSVWHRWKNKLRSEIYFVELIGNKTRGSKPLAIRQKMLRSHESKLCVCLAETIDVIDEMERSKITDHRQYTQLEFFTVDHVGYSLASVFTYEWYHSPRPPEVLFHNIDCWSSYSSFILEGKDALKKGVGFILLLHITPYSHASALCTSSIGHTESPIGNQSVNPNQPDPTAASSSSTAREEGPRRDESSRKKPRAEFEEEQARVLAASLRHVPRLGWTEEAMIAGSREVGVSPSIVGSFSRKEAALVEYFMDECLQLLIDRVDSGLDLQNMIPSERVSKLVRIRLEMQIPYMSKWPQALSIQAHPVNVPTSFKQRAMLVDEIWHTVGDGASDLDWYVKRTVLGGVYSTTEIYMLTDDSPEYRDTWAFLDDRVKDAFDLKKSIQEAKYFAQDIGAGVGKSFQGLMNGVMQTMSRRGGSSAF